ncbi:MAG TPA: STAS domain-containing protein [Solirubrobacteraceae bacterium]|jgi:stage II sporulation protein AA (anti-sigma F factor antagonist)|nr:STAS domain-containing protein [Solirubrobacteraceae bacterium]
MPAGELGQPARRQDVVGLSFQVLVRGGRRTLRLSGELDLAWRTPLEDVIARIARGRCEVVIDLRALTFMDTSGVHVVLAARDLCAVCGCALRLIPGSVAVQRVFELAGVLDQLQFQAEESLPRPGMSEDSSGDGADPDRLAALGVGRAASPPIHHWLDRQNGVGHNLALWSTHERWGRRIHLSGELDSETAPRLESLALRLSADGADAVALDLRGLTRIDAIGVRALVFTYAICDSDGFDFRLIPGPRQVRRVIARCGARDLLQAPLEAGLFDSDWSNNHDRRKDDLCPQ